MEVHVGQIANSLVFDEGTRTTTLAVKPKQDTDFEGTEFVRLELLPQKEVVRDTNYFPSVKIPGWDIVTIAGEPRWILVEPDYVLGTPAAAKISLRPVWL